MTDMLSATRYERIDKLADYWLNKAEWADTPATDVWDAAADEIDSRDAKRRAGEAKPDGTLWASS